MACGNAGGGSTTETASGGDTTTDTTATQTGETPTSSGTTTTTTEAPTTSDGTTDATATTGEPPGTTTEATTASATTEPVGDGLGEHCITPGSPVPAAASPAGPKLAETITVAGDAVVGDVDISLILTSVMKASYLELRLIHGGVTVLLMAGQCPNNRDVGVTFDDEAEPLACCPDIFCTGEPLVGTFQASEALAAFDGLPVAGDWTLEVLAPMSGNPSARNQGVLEELCIRLSE